MVQKFKIKSQEYLAGNVTLITLLIFSLLCFLFCAGLIPEVLLQLFQKSAFENAKGYIIKSVSLFLMFFSFAIINAVSFGTDRFFLRKAQNKGESVKDIFYYFSFKKLFSLLGFSVFLWAIKGAFMIVCFTPSLSLLFFLTRLLRFSFSVKGTIILFTSVVILAFNGLYFYKRLTAFLFLSRYIYIEGSFINYRQILSFSALVMDKKGRELKKIKLSFFPWFVSCIFIIPAAYVFSYYRQTLCVAAEDFMNKSTLQTD